MEPIFDPVHQCFGKRAYRLFENAVVAAGRHSGMHEYRCPHCGFWHVGHYEGFMVDRVIETALRAIGKI